MGDREDVRLDEAMAEALRHHAEGRLKEAEDMPAGESGNQQFRIAVGLIVAGRSS